MNKIQLSGLIIAAMALIYPEAKAGIVVDLTETNNNFTVRVADTTSSTEITRDFKDGVLLVDHAADLNSHDFYGGFSVQGEDITDAKFFDRAGISAVAFQGASGSNTTTLLKVCMVWDSADFLAAGLNEFDASAGSSFSYAGGFANYNGLRFVIRDGTQYYISTDHGFGSASATIDGTTAGLQWATFNPSEYTTFDTSAGDLGMSSLGAFSAMTFNNVTGVGIISEGERPSGISPTWNIDQVQVALVPEPATLGLVAAAGAGLLFVRRILHI